MVAIGILDELQEPGPQCLDDEPDLLPCPEAIDQLLNCPCPMDVEGDPDEHQGVAGEGEHERHPLPGVAGGEQLLHEVVPERVHHELRGVAGDAGEDEVHLALAVVEPLLQEPAPVLVPGHVVHEPAQAGEALAAARLGCRCHRALLGARRRRRGAAGVLPPGALAPGALRGRWSRRRRGAPEVPAVGGGGGGAVEGEGIEQRRHVRAVVGDGERRRGRKVLALLGENQGGEAEAIGGGGLLRRLVVAIDDAHRGELVDEEGEVLRFAVGLAAAAVEAAVVEEGYLVEQHLHLPVELHLQPRRISRTPIES
uniref:Uncharacterized protein n=1 Tax=Arundo donax TaxID=35708 RepID=A0A0A9FPT0_ARUDO